MVLGWSEEPLICILCCPNHSVFRFAEDVFAWIWGYIYRAGFVLVTRSCGYVSKSVFGLLA